MVLGVGSSELTVLRDSSAAWIKRTMGRVQAQIQYMNDRPEITEPMKQKEARRRRLAKLSFEEKIEIIERLRTLQINRHLMHTRLTGMQFDQHLKVRRKDEREG